MKGLTQAWHQHEGELCGWLRFRLKHPADADAVLQDVFEKAMLQGEHFCSVRKVNAFMKGVSKCETGYSPI